MVAFVFSLLISLFLNPEIEPAYYYFGNSDLVGVGNIVSGKKSGEWKVYSKIEPDNSNQSTFEELDSQTFEMFYNQDLPVYIINFSEDLPNGLFQENYPSGSIKTLAFLQNGELNDDFKEFFENGEKKFIGTYANGKKVGEWQEYNEEGQIKSSIKYKVGLADGSATYFYPDGRAEVKLSYSKGEPDGLYEAFFPDGEIRESGHFNNGVPTGSWLSFNLDRKTKFQGIYENGFRAGEWLEIVEILPEYYRKGNYENGLKEGEWVVNDGEGNQVQIETYKEGKLMTVIEIWNADKLKNEEILKNGNGQRIFFDEQGFIKAKGRISKGEINGNWSFYFPNSNRLASSGKLLGIERIGIWEFYSFDGEVIDRIDYSDTSDSGYDGNGGDTQNFYRISPSSNNDSLGAAYEKFYPFNHYRIGTN